MKEQVIYSLKIRNPQTGTTYVKFGYTDDIIRRVKQLMNGLCHTFELNEIKLFKHKTKNIGYLGYEKRLHEKHSAYSVPVPKYILKVGYTECYDSCMRTYIESNLLSEGFECVYDEIENLKKLEAEQHAMFTW